jgi:hypothetical protein
MRNMTPELEAALIAADARPALFFEGQFATGVVRLWTGLGDVVWGGQTWTGAGNLVGFSGIEEGSDIVARGASVTLSGVPASLVSLAISDAQQGLPGRCWVGLLAPDATIIVDPVLAFAGRLDVPTITDGVETCTITITYESRLIDLNRPRELRYTDEAQQQLYPGDRGFEYVTTIQDKELRWGRG